MTTRRCIGEARANGVATPFCNREVHRWRACGVAGCGGEITYCDQHGGDLRAATEMREHAAKAHPDTT